ncbi:MAG: hypothetical protein J1G38_01810 [Clostridiales bacterium]|nr:hypothetical protein [Clostridiales bacterium]
MDKAAVKSKLDAIGKAILAFAKRNYLMLGYIVAAILIELTGVAVTSGRFYMTEPWLYFTFIAIPCIISIYLKNGKVRYALFVTALAANFVLDFIFIVIFDSTGGTVFDYAMFGLRNDAMMIVESLPISFTFVFVSGIIISVYCTLGVMLKKYMPEPNSTKSAMIITSAVLAFCIGADAMLLYFDNYQNNANDLSFRLYRNETGTYSNKGIIGNFTNELARGWWFSDIDMGDTGELGDFIYAVSTEPTEMFGVAKDYNVVTILCESFEWFTFLMDEENYPYGFAKQIVGLTEEERAASKAEIQANLRKLFPNLYRLYDSESTVVFNNAHSLDKTDISENKAIIGNYPLYEYINNTYPTNTLPFSLPNTLKSLYGIESNSFHDGTRTFYNRNVHHVNALGFESFTPVEDMGFEVDETGLGERNLDSLMMEYCKTRMFPAGRPFNTFITTITQHGQYAYRENLKDNYARMDELGILPFDEDDEDGNSLRYYVAAGMDLDKAVGIMLDYLDNTDYLDSDGNPVTGADGKRLKLADRTIVTMYGDHNCYYQGVSNYVKDIYSFDAINYTELYRVPVMMKIGTKNLGGNNHGGVDGTSNAYFIEKFTCVVDIMPTILDVLGIRGFKNLMHGVSAFSDEESVLYSRAYDKFMTDKIYFNSLDHIIYQAEDADIEEIEQKCLELLEKISHINRIFAGDFFKGERGKVYYEKLKALQAASEEL